MNQNKDFKMANSLDEIKCQKSDQFECRSSLDKDSPVMAFKMTQENVAIEFSNIEKIIHRYELKSLSKSDNALVIGNDDMVIEFFHHDKKIELKATELQNSFFHSPELLSLIEKIRFDFYQKNY